MAQQGTDFKLKTRDKIFIGGLGALTPIVMNLLMVDLEKLLINITLIAVVAYMIKVGILFYIGGIIAFLNKDENKPIKLFQLGIYAPAMIIAFMNSNPLDSNATKPNFLPIDNKVNRQVKPIEKDSISTSSTIFSVKPPSPSLFTTSFFQTKQQEDKKKDRQDSIKKVVTNMVDLKNSMDIKDSTFIIPLLFMVAESDAAMFDTLVVEMDARKKKVTEVILSDTTRYNFSYPNETYSEQFVRGFFGWQSDRLWHIIMGKFTNEEAAVMYAKRLTLEMNDRFNETNWPKTMDGTKVVPQLFNPYGTMLPEYCVVMGKQLTLNDAQKLMLYLKQTEFSTANTKQMELWKFPY